MRTAFSRVGSHLSRRTAATLVALFTLVALVAGVLSPPGATAEEPIDYVALGDSFSAGSGVLPLDLSITPLCSRTTRNYPKVIARRTGAQLVDKTCGGADTTDFSTAQYPGLTTPQFAALNAGTDLVTMTIGGNDQSVFLNAIVKCGTAGASTSGFGSPCKNRYGDRFDRQVDDLVYPAVRKALQDTKAKAPNARVAILGYPWLLPPTGGCFAKMPIARGDVPYLRALQGHLNQVIQKAAGETGVQFIDLSVASNGHDACQPIGTRWVEPVLFGTNWVPVHPNAMGEERMADVAMAALGLN